MSSIPVVKYGSGPISVVLLHGFCEDRRIFENVMPLLDQKNFTWYLPDLPGFGDAVNLGLLELSMTGYADQVRDWILDNNKGSVILAGHSMGGYVALEFASHYAQQLKGVVLIHSQMRPDSAEKKKGRDEQVKFLKKHGISKYVKKVIPSLYTPEFCDANPDLIRLWIQRASLYNDTGISLAIQSMRDRKDHTKTVQDLTIPVGFIAGAKDPLIPIESSLEESHLASVTSFHLLDNAGHMGMVEDPEEFAQVLQATVEQLSVK
ncbi:MAG: alpha/beta hydrolase [Saprospiraceae bacterium]|nr:alpha/beta hydrolase [Saprospiraceae bacterium]